MNTTTANTGHAIRATTLASLLGLMSVSVSADTPPTGETAPGPETRPDGKSYWVWKNYGPPSASGGVNGPNRKVVIKGYRAVKGDFADPTWYLNPDTPNNKPTFYLGAQANFTGGKTTTEAGLQWEPEEDLEVGISAGWSVFHRITLDKWASKGQWHLWYNPPGRARVGYQGLGQTSLRYEFQPDRKAVLYVRTSKWDWAKTTQRLEPLTAFPSGSDINVDFAGMAVRRNVGLTQAGGTWLAGTRLSSERSNRALVNQDGSYVENLNFSGGMISDKFQPANGGTISDADYISWPGDSNKPPTAPQDHWNADPHGNTDVFLPDTRRPENAPWVIDFPNKRRDEAAPGAYTTGYKQENVVIDLRRAKEVKGKTGTE